MRRRTQRAPLRIVITGAAAGVGLACAVALAECGAELILCDRDRVGVARAGSRFGAFSRCCDLISERGIEAFSAELEDAFQGIDVLINAAGSAYVRSLGVLRMTRALLPLLRKGSGRRLIINIASAGGFASSDCMFPYAGSREAFHALSEALAEQARGTSIRVATVIPRLVRGRVRQAVLEPGQIYWLERVDADATVEDILSLVALIRPGLGDQAAEPKRRA